MKTTYINTMTTLALLKAQLLEAGLFQECKRSFNSLTATIEKLLEKENSL